MLRFFEKQVDRRSKKAMIAFLEEHFRYFTMNSWNNASSYANKTKVGHLGLLHALENKAHEFISTEGYWDEIDEPIRQFTSDQNNCWTIGSNGRSGGYLVLYRAQQETLDYKSRCCSCGQLNYKLAPSGTAYSPAEAVIADEILRSQNSWRAEVYLTQRAVAALAMSEADKLAIIHRLKLALRDTTPDNRCGACGKSGEKGRINLTRPITRLSVMNGGVDDEEDFNEWSMSRLRDRVELVQAFDRACDQIRSNFIDLLQDCEVVEEVIMAPKTVRRLSCHA